MRSELKNLELVEGSRGSLRSWGKLTEVCHLHSYFVALERPYSCPLSQPPNCEKRYDQET
jgi:hypothetical protein